MAPVTILSVHDVGNDRIEVRGYVGQPVFNDAGEQINIVMVSGWKSAMTNHHPEDHYKDDGHLHADAVAREMTQFEKGKYWQQLIWEVAPHDPVSLYEHPNPPQPPQPEPKPRPEIDSMLEGIA